MNPNLNRCPQCGSTYCGPVRCLRSDTTHELAERLTLERFALWSMSRERLPSAAMARARLAVARKLRRLDAPAPSHTSNHDLIRALLHVRELERTRAWLAQRRPMHSPPCPLCSRHDRGPSDDPMRGTTL